MPPRPNIFDRQHDPLKSAVALERHIEAALAARPNGGWELQAACGLLEVAFRPTFLGAERLPQQPCLFVGNHGLFAIDGMIFLPLMLHRFGRFLRPMGDRFLFANRRLARWLQSQGATMGHPEVCRALMAHGHDLLVFPGGAHEAVKPARQNYTLQWKQRSGFIRLAAEAGYTVVPFAMIGPDEFYDHLVEGETLADSAASRWLHRAGLLPQALRTDLVPPLVRGALGTALPKPEPCFVSFAEPLNLARYRGRELNNRQLGQLRRRVAERIEREIESLLAYRRVEPPPRGLLRRILTI